MKIDGHFQMTKAAIKRVKKNHAAPRSVKVIPTFNCATNAVSRDILDVITLGHWLNGSQKHHFMRRFDGQSEFDAYKEAVTWIRKNVNMAAQAVAMAVRLGRNPYHRSTIGGNRRQSYLSQASTGIGYASHAIQDSFAHGHCERENLSLNGNSWGQGTAGDTPWGNSWGHTMGSSWGEQLGTHHIARAAGAGASSWRGGRAAGDTPYRDEMRPVGDEAIGDTPFSLGQWGHTILITGSLGN